MGEHCSPLPIPGSPHLPGGGLANSGQEWRGWGQVLQGLSLEGPHFCQRMARVRRGLSAQLISMGWYLLWVEELTLPAGRALGCLLEWAHKIRFTIKDLVMCWQSLGLPSQGDSLTPGGLGLPRSPGNGMTPTFLCCSLSCSGSEGRELSESLSLGSGCPELLAPRESHHRGSRPRWALTLNLRA